MSKYIKIQSQIHASNLRSSPLAIPAGPFTCFLNPNDAGHYANFAIPTEPFPENWEAAIEELIAVFTAHGRMPRLEFIAACAPALEAALHENGFTTESHTVMMVCTPQSLQPLPSIPGLTFEFLDAESSLESYREFNTIPKRAFGSDEAPEATLEEAADSRARYGNMIKVLARLEGVPVSVGTVTHPFEGVAEVAGIATATPYRRRGFAGAVTGMLAARAFATGLELAFLSAADERAGRVYERAGFLQTETYQVNISRSSA